MEFVGKAAIVTGAGSGIGRASAVAFARAGASVLALDISDGALEETVREIRATGGIVEPLRVDVTDSTAVERAIGCCLDKFGSVDIAHNNAGLNNAQGEFAEVSTADAMQLMNVNFWGTFHCMQAEIRQMLRQGGGIIVNTASSAAIVAQPGLATYCASKHAVLGLTKSVAAEYAGRGIRINAVCPGFVETPMTSAYSGDEKLRDMMLAMHPVGRFASPEEIADAVLWLASSHTGFVIGAGLVIDGGYSLA